MNDAQDIRQLTALRFFAAFWVVLFHYWPSLQSAGAPLLVQKGYLGVELFFILSGFILCHVYRTQVERERFNYGAFLWARLARIYPLHLATLVAMGAMAVVAGLAGFAVDPNILSWQALPANLLLVQAWGFAPVAGWNHPSWSISAEWFAYLTFPAFAWAALKLRHRPTLAVGLAIGMIFGLYTAFEAVTGRPLTQATIAWGALRIVPCFAFGCALHALWRARTAQSPAAAIAGALAAVGGVLILVATAAPDALIVTGLGLVILYVARMAQSGSQGFGNPALVYLGEISYSIYMICVPLKIVFANGAAKLLQINGDQLPMTVWVAMVLTVIPVAALSYHLIERPARSAMKGWADSLQSRRPSAAPA